MAHGVGNARVSPGFIITLGIAAGIVVVGLILGYVLVPGFIFLAIAFSTAFPQRWIAMTDQGVAIFGRQLFTGRLDRVLVSYPHEVFVHGAPLPPGGVVELHFGKERVKLSRTELDRMQSVVVGLTGRPVTQPAVLPAG